MKILIIEPANATLPFAKENLSKITRPDTEITMQNISAVYPLHYTCQQYLGGKAGNACAEMIVRAEQDGYDGAIIACMADPGLEAARQAVDIPVLGVHETTCATAHMMGGKFSIVATGRYSVSAFANLVRKYGFESKLASIRHLGLEPGKIDTTYVSPEDIVNKTKEVARKCVDEDGADVIISGCTIHGAELFELSKADSPDSIGAPILDPVSVTLKMAEAMIELGKKTGYPAVSRVGLYQKTPDEYFDTTRKWLSTNPSPEQHYYREPLKPKVHEDSSSNA